MQHLKRPNKEISTLREKDYYVNMPARNLDMNSFSSLTIR
jgi:hypothetical protein